MIWTGRQRVAIGVKGVAQVTVVVFVQIEVAGDVQIRGGIHETHGRAEVPLEAGVDREGLEDRPEVVDCRHTRRLDGCLSVRWP